MYNAQEIASMNLCNIHKFMEAISAQSLYLLPYIDEFIAEK